MTPVQTELLDQAILRALRDNKTIFGWPAGVVGRFVAADGFPNLSQDDLVFRLEYLTQKSLLKEVSKKISAVNRAWKIDDAGLQYLDEHNL